MNQEKELRECLVAVEEECKEILQVVHKSATSEKESVRLQFPSKLDIVRQMLYTTVYIVTEKEFCINIIMLKSLDRKKKSDHLMSIELLCSPPLKADVVRRHTRVQSKCADCLFVLNKNSKLWKEKKLRFRILRLMEEFAYALVAVATRGEKGVHKILLERTGLGRPGTKPMSLRHIIDCKVAPNWKPFKRKVVELLGKRYLENLLETDNAVGKSPAKSKSKTPIEVVVLDDDKDDDDCIILDSDETQDEEDRTVIVIEPVGPPSASNAPLPSRKRPAISGLADLFSSEPSTSSAPLLVNPTEYGQPVVIAPEPPEVTIALPTTTANKIQPLAVIWAPSAVPRPMPRITPKPTPNHPPQIFFSNPVRLTVKAVNNLTSAKIDTPPKPTAPSVDGHSAAPAVAAPEPRSVKSVNPSETPKQVVYKTAIETAPEEVPPPRVEVFSPPPASASVPTSPMVLMACSPISVRMKINIPNPLKVQGQLTQKRRTGGLFPKTDLPPPTIVTLNADSQNAGTQKADTQKADTQKADTQNANTQKADTLNAENSRFPVKRGRGRPSGRGRGRERSSQDSDDEEFFPGSFTKKKRLFLAQLLEMPAGECAEVLAVGMTVKNRRHIQFKEYVCFMCLGSTQSFRTSEDFVDHVKIKHLKGESDPCGDQLLSCTMPNCDHHYQLRGRKNNSKLLDMLTPLFVHMTSGHHRPLPPYVLHYCCRECDYVTGIPEFMQKHSLSCRKGLS